MRFKVRAEVSITLLPRVEADTCLSAAEESGLEKTRDCPTFVEPPFPIPPFLSSSAVFMESLALFPSSEMW